ncbi:uncharacterized protein MONOS_4960 [Monocercomonoides exilis]|uniref:uncharacterized protein n=1 Tax=Monocercomonoides exilis TaxID=2049356 RepID=UPI003559C384|nr:hypothetical protein MONOS_4960 [Monocercomonoides exilis]|eukprot:MONOS_4960.1-p1 / transcript=MONOS_4960.1 / gene=MONOS_4960 / organism=Monocercomonoides_exilis_PA203 / gene_product=unspecified product / transcript_product=unspecified product / location=Mono_scaffold00139:25789-28863(-) / protein_length=1025 / sequence_SO=supercontig / SO=protein_coding / is_pseudo=false
MFWGLILFQISVSTYAQEEPSNPQTVYVKQSGNESYSGLEIGKEKQSLKSAYGLLDVYNACDMKIVYDANPLIAEAVEFNLQRIITIEGWKSDGSGNIEVAINCDVRPGSELFVFNCDATLKYLAFHFPTTLKNKDEEDVSFNLIAGRNESLSIRYCRFIPPKADGVNFDISLAYALGGTLTMESVECFDEANTMKLNFEPFVTDECETVILSNFTLKKVETRSHSVIWIHSRTNMKCDLTLNGTTFSECISRSYGILYFDADGGENTFSVGDGGVTSFSSCSCDYFHSTGGIYLRIPTIESANQLKWPKEGRNLIFEKCSAGKGELIRNTGLFLEMANDSLFEEIAFAMKKSFAADYTRRGNKWNIAGMGKNNYEEIDFVSKYFDPLLPPSQNISKIYVKSGITGNGESLENPIDSLKEANELLGMIAREDTFGIAILKSNDPIQAEEILFSKSRGIIIEGVNSNGNGNVEVAIDCDAIASRALFTCEKEVEFKYLAFNFPSSGDKWISLIFGNEMSPSLTISNCRFVRTRAQLSEGGIVTCAEADDSAVGSLVSAISGKVTMNNVSCTDDSICISFIFSPFYFEGTSEISLNGLEVSNVNERNGATITIKDGNSTFSTVNIEGLNMNEVNSAYGDAAGLEIYLHSEESTVSIGRQSRCTFKSCTAPIGIAGVMYIWMAKIKPNLQLPSAGNLDIDSSNTVGPTSKPTSLFIESEGIDEFCKQENVFQFADAFEGSTAGWIMGRKNNQSASEDLYEKYLKWKGEGPKGDDPKEDDPKDKEDKGGDGGNEGNGEEEKPFAWWIIVIVVGVVAVVAVACVILIVMKKKRSSKNRINVEDEENESEGKERKERKGGKGGKGRRNKKRTKRGGTLEEGRPAKNFAVDADSDGSSRKTDDCNDGNNPNGTLEAEYETKEEEEEEEEDRTKKNGEKEANWKGNENASVRQHLDNVKQNINETLEQFEQKEQKEKNGSAIAAKAVSHVLSSTSSSSSFSSVLNEGLQTKELAADIKGLITETNVMSPLSE